MRKGAGAMKLRRIFALCAAVALCLLAGCAARKEEKQVDLSAFAGALKENYEFAAYLMELDPEAEEYARESIEQYLPGLLELDLEQRVIYMSMMRLNNGEFSMVQTNKSPGRRNGEGAVPKPGRLYGGRRGEPRRGLVSRPHGAVDQQLPGGGPWKLCADGGGRGVRPDRQRVQRLIRVIPIPNF